MFEICNQSHNNHFGDHFNLSLSMKLAACYTVFDGTELLEASMRVIAQHVDFFVLSFQMISNKGEHMAAPDRQIMLHFMDGILMKDKPVFCIEYLTDFTVNAKENERRKHTQMIEHARARGATHFLMSACDHFYREVDFGECKHLVEYNDYDATFTAMYTYYKKPTWQITPIEDYYMPFICKLHPETKIQRVPNFPLLVDPSVQMNTLGKWLLFQENEIMLHHYSMIRRDINGKFRNAASPWKPIQIDEFTREWNEYDIKENPGVKYFKERKIKEVRDYFNLNSIL